MSEEKILDIIYHIANKSVNTNKNKLFIAMPTNITKKYFEYWFTLFLLPSLKVKFLLIKKLIKDTKINEIIPE